MKVVILCGGLGIRLQNQINFIPKGMVMIDDKPILWHIMKRYSLFGYNEFVLALGKYGEMIRDYFVKFDIHTHDIHVSLGQPNGTTTLTQSAHEDWEIDFINTGEAAHTGARLKRVQKYVDTDEFMLTYADCLSDVNIDRLLRYHKKNKKIATVTGVMPPYRYGEFILKGGKVVDYRDVAKLIATKGAVNGGFMVLNKEIFGYLTSYNECTLEIEVFKKLTRKNELSVYHHDGFWQCLDNDREYAYIKRLCDTNKRYWLIK